MKIRITLEVDVCEASLANNEHGLSPAQIWLSDYDLLFQVKGNGSSPADEHITLVGYEPVA